MVRLALWLRLAQFLVAVTNRRTLASNIVNVAVAKNLVSSSLQNSGYSIA